MGAGTDTSPMDEWKKNARTEGRQPSHIRSAAAKTVTLRNRRCRKTEWLVCRIKGRPSTLRTKISLHQGQETPKPLSGKDSRGCAFLVFSREPERMSEKFPDQPHSAPPTRHASHFSATRVTLREKGNPEQVRIPFLICHGTKGWTRTPTGFSTTPSRLLRHGAREVDVRIAAGLGGAETFPLERSVPFDPGEFSRSTGHFVRPLIQRPFSVVRR